MDSMRWRRANVLVVDDQPANLVTLDAVLSADFNVVRAASGEAALEVLRSQREIDVILLDVQMPGMDGFEVAARVKQLPGCADIPIVFVTAVYHEDPFVKRGYEAGAVDYFSKPFDPQVLRAKVAIYASFRQKADLLQEWARQIEESQELLNAGRQFAAMVEYLRMGVAFVDSGGHVRQLNPEAADPAFMQVLEGRANWSTLARRGTFHETREVAGADGTPRFILCTVSPLHERAGADSGAVVILRDVTERRRLEQDLERRIQGLVNRSGAEAP
jgi:CheY-like chemotaxis protein